MSELFLVNTYFQYGFWNVETQVFLKSWVTNMYFIIDFLSNTDPKYNILVI